MFENRMIQRMPDGWNFDYRLEHEPDAIVPLTMGGYVRSRQEWLAIRNAVDLFYASVSDEEIDGYNNNYQAQLDAQEEERSKAYRAKQTSKPPKPGFIYLLRSGTGEYKIGKSVNPNDRKKLIGIQMPQQIDLLYTAKMLNMSKAEDTLHAALSEWHVNGEWFNPPPHIIQWILTGHWLDTCGLREECEEEKRFT